MLERFFMANTIPQKAMMILELQNLVEQNLNCPVSKHLN